MRRIDWNPPAPGDLDAVTGALRSGGARPWQIALVAPVIADGLRATAVDVAAAQALLAEAEAGGEGPEHVAQGTPD